MIILPGRRFNVRRIGVAITAPVLTLSVISGIQASASATVRGAPPLPKMVAASGVGVLRTRPVPRKAPSPVSVPTAVLWPKAASAIASLDVTAPGVMVTKPGTALLARLASMTALGTGRVAGVGTPLWAERVAGRATSSAPKAVRLTILPHGDALAAGVKGVVFTVAAAKGGAGGALRVGISYAEFSQVSGGNYGLGLGLVRLPACALTAPSRPACQREVPIASLNDPATQSVSAQVTVPGGGGPLVLAAAPAFSDGGDSAGTYAATSLKPSGTWTAGGSSGSFTYSYPLPMPPAASSLTPTLSLVYDSGEIDGQTASTQAQASWVGDGWTLAGGSSFIEQSFKACQDNPEGDTSLPAADQTPDECYDGPVITLSQSSGSSPLVCPVPFSYTQDSNCTAATDNGEVITHHVASGNGNGSQFTDYWTVTARDGLTYYYGRNELPGWTSGKATTNSVDTVPVYSSQSGDPCYSSTSFHSCPMAYRWNLDYVTDPHGNAMAYYYAQDSNAYAADGATSSAVGYVRDSHLARIDYGFTAGNAYSGSVPDQVVFTTADRCFAGASSCDPIGTGTNASNWQDVPYTQDYCAAKASCQVTDPTFWSTVALASVTTQQWNGTKYVPVDSWALAHEFPPNGDGTSPALFLDSITHTGEDTTAGGASVPMPPVTFDWHGAQLANRVNPGNYPAMIRPRIATITAETGSVITVTYETVDTCNPSSYPAPADNHSSCFPVFWQQFTSATGPDWFNKWAVASVSVSDPYGGSPGTFTSYSYSAPAWHYDDNELVAAKYRTYGQWRGYQDVIAYGGNGSPQTESETTYYQGMSDDNNTTAVLLPDSQHGQHEDINQLAGDTLESTAYLSAGTVDHSTIYSYWVSAAAATRARSGLPALTANATGKVEEWSRQAITDSGSTTWRQTEIDTSYDTNTGDPDFGLPLFTFSHGDLSDSTQQHCTSTTYAQANATLNLVGLVAETRSTAGACGGSNPGGASVPGAGQVNALSAGSGAVISDTRTFYDDPSLADTWPQAASPTFPQTGAPTMGEPSEVRQAVTESGSTLTWQVKSAGVYDSYGRPTDTWDGDGNHTKTTYTMANGLTASVQITNPKSQSTTTAYDTLRGIPVKVTDPNGIVTTEQYDGLGRLTSVWKNNRTTGSPANDIYSYTVLQNPPAGTAPALVTSKILNDESGYVTSTTLYDSLLRLRQTQQPTPQGGVLVTDHFYDSRGLEWKTNSAWWDKGANPSANILTVLDSQVPNQTETAFDGLGRPIMVTSYDDSAVRKQTATAYYGDTVLTVPPTGGTPTATVTDALGRTTELDSYTSRPTVTTTFDAAGFITSVAISGGSYQATDYSYAYGANGGLVSTIKDVTTSEAWTKTADLLGETTGVTDPNAGASTMSYDAAGNLTQTKDANGHYITWTYDPLNRRTGEYDGTSNLSPQIASWTYDTAGVTDSIGHLVTETSSYGGATYTVAQKGFTVFGQSTGETVTIPSGQGALSGTYTLTHLYSSTTGLLLRDGYPAAPAPANGSTPLPAETVTHGYQTGFDLPAGLGGLNAYVQNITWNDLSQMQQEEIGSTTANAYITNAYDENTGALTDSQVQNTTASATPYDDTSYTYDPAGNITAETDTRNGSAAETQCFRYDTLDRLLEAWTGNDSCKADPLTSGTSTIGDGIAGSAYWTSWNLSPMGDRTTQTIHSLTGGNDTVTSYTYGKSDGTQPDTLAKTVTTTGSSSTTTTYAPDSDGNTTTFGSQTLTWTHDGKLATSSAGSTSYAYDADGNVLLTKSATQATIYLFGGSQQITLTTSGTGSGTITGTRILALPGGGEAVRTGTATPGTSTTPGTTTTSTAFEMTDQHGTGVLTLNSACTTPTWRQFDPYGNPRGTAPGTWPDPGNAFLGKPHDANTGLDILGARDYDPAIGRFISVDPVLEQNSPQELNGFTYAADNPLTHSDPSGLSTGQDESACAANITLCMYNELVSNGSQVNSEGIPTGVGYIPGSSDPACGYSKYCGPLFNEPPEPKPVQMTVLADPFQCGHLSVCDLTTTSVIHYQNDNTDWDLLMSYVTGIGARNQYFNQWDPMTQYLMNDPNNKALMQGIGHVLSNPMNLGLGPGYDPHDKSDYHDAPTPGNYYNDGLGAISGGTHGHNFADSFTGSYVETWTAVYRSPHIATVYFTAVNVTNLQSLLHPEVTGKVSQFIPIVGAYLAGLSNGLPWDAGPFSSMTQIFQWQQNVKY